MSDRFSRTRLIFGDNALQALAESRVVVFGVGGVGGYVTEALARSGVGAIDIVDGDVVSESNINRQIYALTSTLGRYKVEVAAERIADINPECKVTPHRLFFDRETAGAFDFSVYDYVVDAIDTVSSKLLLIEMCSSIGVPIISSMGAGNKLDPTRFEAADIYETSIDPLARVIRRECRKRGNKRLRVVYSTEEPRRSNDDEQSAGRRPVPGSCAFVPSAAGLVIAGEVIRALAGLSGNN